MLVSVRTQNFKVITKVTEGRTLDVLPAIDFLLDAFSNELTKAAEEDYLSLTATVKCGWEIDFIFCRVLSDVACTCGFSTVIRTGGDSEVGRWGAGPQ
jgi:hypothetical protein